MLAYILSLYILFCAVAPCYLFDACEETEQSADASKSNPVKDCNNCSPFSTCSSCHGFAFRQENMLEQPSPIYLSIVYSHYSFSSKTGYLNLPFQPPRVA
jgi:cytochrome c553